MVAIGVACFNVPLLHALVHRGIATCGTIITIEPQNHNSINFSYEVNGKTHNSVQQGGVSGNGADFSPCCRDNVVYYLPENPQPSCIGFPRPMFNNELNAILVRTLVFPTSILLVWRRHPAIRRWLNEDFGTSWQTQKSYIWLRGAPSPVCPPHAQVI